MDVMDDPVLFTADQVCRLTGLSDRQLRYWGDTGFFSARGGSERRLPYTRTYTFRDAVGLRALAEMRNRYHVSLQALRKVGAVLAQQFDSPWSELTFYVVGRNVFCQEDKADTVKHARHGQQVWPIAMTRIEGDVRKAIAAQRKRAESQIGRVTQRRYVAGGQPVLDGTRVPTRAVWVFHRAGYSRQAIAEEYPDLTPRDIDAAIDFEQEQFRRAG